MMRLFVLACVLGLVSATTAATPSNAPDARPALYSFDWHVSSGAAAPLQVFDNGQRVYLQFRTGAPVPAIFADTPGGLILLDWREEAPYVVINHMESRLRFRLGSEEARAWRKASGPPGGVVTGAATPRQVTASAEVPRSLATLTAQRQAADELTDDRSYRRDAHAAPVGSVARPYVLLDTDRTVALAFARWAGMAGWTVNWDSPITAPITAPSEPLGDGDFVAAVQAVMDALRAAGYPLNATFGERSVHVYELKPLMAQSSAEKSR